jgi:uncharacterized repeat protein (TIGR03803 family)
MEPDPEAGLVQGSDGNFYGTTNLGGSGVFGTVFEMTPAGVLTTLVSFGSLGYSPTAGLVLGSDGNFYGTTNLGGADGLDDGTVFKMTPAGALTTLFSFDGTNGANPSGNLIQASDGNFYGVTNGARGLPDGTVFKMTPAGVLTTLATFTGANGDQPVSGLVQGNDGNLYGVTPLGGINDEGVIFRVVLSPPTLNFEAENLSYTSSGATNSIQTDIHSSGGKWVKLAGNGNGDHIDFTVPGIPAGTYQLKMKWKGNNNRGILHLSVDGNAVGNRLDQYSADQTYPTTTFGTVTFATAGNHDIRLTVIGKNSSSSGRVLSADKFTLVGQ